LTVGVSMVSRLDKLGEILMDYKRDIAKLLAMKYVEIANEIENVKGKQFGDRGYIEFIQNVDVKYVEVRTLRELLTNIDKMYNELAIVDSMVDWRD